jgi:hypothetical protein
MKMTKKWFFAAMLLATPAYAQTAAEERHYQQQMEVERQLDDIDRQDAQEKQRLDDEEQKQIDTLNSEHDDQQKDDQP